MEDGCLLLLGKGGFAGCGRGAAATAAGSLPGCLPHPCTACIPCLQTQTPPVSRLTAAHVADELLGDSKVFDYQPFFYSRVFNLSWQVRGAGGRRGVRVVLARAHDCMNWLRCSCVFLFPNPITHPPTHPNPLSKPLLHTRNPSVLWAQRRRRRRAFWRPGRWQVRRLLCPGRQGGGRVPGERQQRGERCYQEGGDDAACGTRRPGGKGAGFCTERLTLAGAAPGRPSVTALCCSIVWHADDCAAF